MKGTVSSVERNDAADRLEMAHQEAKERLGRSQSDIHRCLVQGLGWTHPTVTTHRARLVAAMAELAAIELLIGGAK